MEKNLNEGLLAYQWRIVIIKLIDMGKLHLLFVNGETVNTNVQVVVSSFLIKLRTILLL